MQLKTLLTGSSLPETTPTTATMATTIKPASITSSSAVTTSGSGDVDLFTASDPPSQTTTTTATANDQFTDLVTT